METDKLQIIETVMDQIRSLTTTNDLPLQIMDALQFQDITTQQIEATKAIVSELDEEIGALSKGLLQEAIGGSVRFHVDGVFDPEAAYDHRRARQKQNAADLLFEKGANTACTLHIFHTPEERIPQHRTNPPGQDRNHWTGRITLFGL